jgi:hypothetical protein
VIQANINASLADRIVDNDVYNTAGKCAHLQNGIGEKIYRAF